MKRLEDFLITSTFTLAMLGPPNRRRGLAECIAAGHLTCMPANYSLKGVVEADIITATYAETNHVTGAGNRETCSLGVPAPSPGKTACFGLDTYIWAALSKEATVSGEQSFTSAVKLKAENWVQTVQYDKEGTFAYSWAQIKRVWIMELDEQISMSNVGGNFVTQHHKVSVKEPGWAQASSVGTPSLYSYNRVLNFSLHECGNVVMPHDVYAATLGYIMPEESSQGLRTCFPTYPGDAISRFDDIRSSTLGTVRLGPLGAQEHPNGEVTIDESKIIVYPPNSYAPTCWTGVKWELSSLKSFDALQSNPAAQAPKLLSLSSTATSPSNETSSALEVTKAAKTGVLMPVLRAASGWSLQKGGDGVVGGVCPHGTSRRLLTWNTPVTHCNETSSQMTRTSAPHPLGVDVSSAMKPLIQTGEGLDSCTIPLEPSVVTLPS